MFSKWQHSRWVLRAHQTRNARIVPPKISNASPHKEKFIAQSAASLSIRPACALSSLIDTNIEALKWGSRRKYTSQWELRRLVIARARSQLHQVPSSYLHPFWRDTYYDRYSNLIFRAAEASLACSKSAAEPGHSAAQQWQAGPAAAKV